MDAGSSAGHIILLSLPISSSPLRLKPSLQEKVARPPILKVVKIMEPLAGFSKGLQSVSLQIGASGSHLPLVSHLRRSGFEPYPEKRIDYTDEN